MTNCLIVADANKCIGCKTCEIACVMSHSDNIEMTPENFHPRLKVIKGMKITVPVTCRQCDNAPCANACPTNAIVRKANSIQVIQERCIGCKSCMLSCPFGAMDVVTQELSINQQQSIQTQALKCDLCIDNPNGPACVSACPTNTLKVYDPKMIDQMIKEKQQNTIREEIAIFT